MNSELKIHMKKIILRSLICVLGIAIICLGEAIFYLINLGSDPYQVFMIGLHKTLNISYGLANFLSNAVIVVFLLIFARKYVKLALFIATIFAGYFIDLFVMLLKNSIQESMSFPIKLIFAVVGCILLAFGVYLYLLPKLGASSPDSVGLILSEVTKVPYKFIRIFTDLFFSIIGFLFGGTIGVVTITSVLVTGPLIGIFDKLFCKTSLHKKITELNPKESQQKTAED